LFGKKNDHQSTPIHPLFQPHFPVFLAMTSELCKNLAHHSSNCLIGEKMNPLEDQFTESSRLEKEIKEKLTGLILELRV
jgi:hypothetical protein